MTTKHKATGAAVKKQPGFLPDYRWVATGQEIIVRPQDVGEPEGVPVFPAGMFFAENGDLLLGVSVLERGAGHGRRPEGAPRMVLLRSGDKGHTWFEQGALYYKNLGTGSGCIDALTRIASGRLVGRYSMHHSIPNAQVASIVAANGWNLRVAH